MLPFLKIENGDDLIEYKFCGYFGWTDNNLGLIGKSKEDGIYYLISCGANGIINAFAGTEILLDLFENRDNPLIPFFVRCEINKVSPKKYKPAFNNMPKLISKTPKTINKE